MSPDSDRLTLRASDADRERAVSALRAHAGEGRLEPEELEQRVEAALLARTLADLRGLMADLPASPPSSPRGAARSGRASGRHGLGEHARAFVAVHVLLVAIWALSGFGYFWVGWSLMGWGIGLLAHARCGRRSRRGRRRDTVALLG